MEFICFMEPAEIGLPPDVQTRHLALTSDPGKTLCGEDTAPFRKITPCPPLHLDGTGPWPCVKCGKQREKLGATEAQ